MGKYDKSNLIVDLTYYNKTAEAVKKCCNDYEGLLDTYISYLNELNQNGIVSGKTADILRDIIVEISGVKGDISEIGSSYAAIIQEFLSAVDGADKTMFDKKSRKCFTDEEFAKAKAAASISMSLGTFTNGIRFLSSICNVRFIEVLLLYATELIKKLKAVNEYTKKDLDKIQNKLNLIDNSYKLALSNIYKELINYKKIIIQLSDIMTPDGNHFSSRNLSELKKKINSAKKFKENIDENPFYIKITQDKVVNKKNSKYKNISISDYVIPGLDQGFVPQGITYDKEHGYIIISGYYEGDNKGYPSQLMIIDEKTGKLVKVISLKKKDGSCYTGHAGGVAYSNGKLYISSDGYSYTITGEELKNADANDCIRFSEEKKIDTAGSYANESNGVLYYGNFHEPGKEEAGIKPITVNGKKCYSYCEAYDQNTGEKYYILTPDRTQGMTVKEDGTYMFSTSYGRNNNSQIYSYTKRTDKPIGYVDGIPVYGLEGETVTEAPPMSEGMCNINGKTYVINESGSKKYREGTDGNGKCEDPTDSVLEIK
ncbi:MAG: hypothetical protein ACI4IE_09020 [Eubacterium sp.]